MNGSNALIHTLVSSGVDLCIGNPGTSEMHFVAALDEVPEMRAVLGLHETVVTGAADGYARMTGRPAATLLHLGPGLGNGYANLHNARRAHTPVVNIVGDHATYHLELDAPLTSDIEAIAGTLEGWVRTSKSTDDVAGDAAEAVAAAIGPEGKVATLILPADVSWGEGAEPAAAVDRSPAASVPPAHVEAVAETIRSGSKCVLLLGSFGLHERALLAASRIAAANPNVTLLAETFPARIERGAGVPAVPRLGYLAEMVEAQLTGTEQLILAGAKSPISFFAYPDKPGELVPEGCSVQTLCGLADDIAEALERLADEVAAAAEPVLQEPLAGEQPSGELNAHAMAQTVGNVLPQNAIVVDESNTSGASLPFTTLGSPRHDLLTLTGGAIGQGLPVATGAALACPDRPVLCLEADGSAMYSIMALWTHAHEQLDITTVILNNSSYSILRMELQRVGAGAGGEKAHSLLDLSTPAIDFTAIAEGMGVPATRATTCEELAEQLERAFATPGPALIEAVLAPLF
jgi:acetolactate synthase-1/2/3 large subunit